MNKLWIIVALASGIVLGSFYTGNPIISLADDEEQNTGSPETNTPTANYNLRYGHNSTSEHFLIYNIDEVGKMDTCCGSMKPTINAHNTMLLREYNREETLSEGEIIRYKVNKSRYNNSHIIHRITINNQEREPDYVWTEGDNRENADRIHLENITHRVVGVIYTGGSYGLDSSFSIKD